LATKLLLPGEQIESYIYTAEELLRRTDPDAKFERILFQFLKGLPAELQTQVRLSRPTNKAELKEILLTLGQAYHLGAQANPFVSSPIISAGTSSSNALMNNRLFGTGQPTQSTESGIDTTALKLALEALTKEKKESKGLSEEQKQVLNQMKQERVNLANERANLASEK